MPDERYRTESLSIFRKYIFLLLFNTIFQVVLYVWGKLCE